MSGSASSGSARRVLFVGSRGLGAEAFPLVRSVVGPALASGAEVGVGCAVGADALVAEAVLRAGAARRLSVFAVGSVFGAPGRSGPSGFWSGSAVGVVCRAARAGASCVWWAGGGPWVGLWARLAARSLAAVRWAAAGGAGSGVVAFVSSPGSPGSWLSCRAAVRCGLPVWVFPVGFSGRLLPSLGSGSWVSLPSGGWLWVPAVSASSAAGVRAEGLGAVFVGGEPAGSAARRFSARVAAALAGGPPVLPGAAPEAIEVTPSRHEAMRAARKGGVRRGYAGAELPQDRMSPIEERSWEKQAWVMEAKWRLAKEKQLNAA